MNLEEEYRLLIPPLDCEIYRNREIRDLILIWLYGIEISLCLQ